MRRSIWYATAACAIGVLLFGALTAPRGADVVDIPGVFNIDSLLTVYPLAADQEARSEEIAWDSVSSMHLTQVRGVVRGHHHAHHSENIWVVRGAGRLVLGDQKYKVMAGDIVHIPKGTSHSFHNLGAVPAVVISVFSPGFDGKDRVYDEK
ncbi:MAG TPA: cupin domain-containing protein [Acidobacteriota bacterium]|nr:cupin domain-containing protein [Acidobacteriota bacterium]